jgi:biotin operon repressor
MIFVTQTSVYSGQQLTRQASSRREAVRVLFDVIDSLKAQGIRVWGSLRSGYQTVVDGELIEIAIQ